MWIILRLFFEKIYFKVPVPQNCSFWLFRYLICTEHGPFENVIKNAVIMSAFLDYNSFDSFWGYWVSICVSGNIWSDQLLYFFHFYHMKGNQPVTQYKRIETMSKHFVKLVFCTFFRSNATNWGLMIMFTLWEAVVFAEEGIFLSSPQAFQMSRYKFSFKDRDLKTFHNEE